MLLEETNNVSPTWTILACTTSVICIFQMSKSMTKQMFHLQNQIKQVAISMGNRPTMHWILKLLFYENCLQLSSEYHTIYNNRWNLLMWRYRCTKSSSKNTSGFVISHFLFITQNESMTNFVTSFPKIIAGITDKTFDFQAPIATKSVLFIRVHQSL